MSVRVRFAPSPTGQVHIGNIRTAIYNWLFARHESGKFLLRVEDTDRERSTPEALQTVMDALQWLGLTPDEEPLYQSTRTQAHVDAAESLVRAGRAYREDKGGTGQGECIIFRMPGTDMAFHDIVKGDLEKKAADMADFVIVRSNGAPVFHLANVVDDVHMGITHIIRGDDHVENTFRHIALFQALGATPPKYAHLPMIINAQGKPYSKRDGAAFVGDFRKMGYSPDALMNYLALLGWSPGDDREKMSRTEMAQAFTLERVKSGPAQMDVKKLLHLNGQYLAEMPREDFLREARSALAGQDWAQNIDDDYFRRICNLLQTRTKLFPDVAGWKYFQGDLPDYDEKAVHKQLATQGTRTILSALRTGLAETDFSAAALEKAIRDVEKGAGLGEGKLNQPVRVAVTGVLTGAGIYETMELLGRDRSLRRLDHAIEKLCG